MSFTPTHYQQAAVRDTVDWLCNNSGNPLTVLPVGTGKSIILNNLTKFFIDDYSQARILHLTHVKELISQNYAALRKMWPDAPAGCYSASLGSRDLFSQIVFGGIQSIHNKAKMLGHVDAIIIDECFSGDTEILTKNGFIRLDKLGMSDIVAQVNQDDMSVSFCNPSRIVNKKPASKMINLSSDHYGDWLITENHEMLIERKFKGGPSITKRKLVDLCPDYRYKMFSAGYGDGNDDFLSDFEKFIIAFQADGTIHKQNKNGTTICYFTFSKERKIYPFLDLCKKLKWRFSEVSCGQGSSENVNPRRRFSITCPQEIDKNLWNYFDISSISAKKARHIIEYMNNWDGHVANDNVWLYTSTDKASIDFYQSVCALAGMHSSFSHVVDNRSEKFSDIYRLFIRHKTNKFGTQRLKKKYVDYSDNVYCVTVPDGNIIVRRGGNIMVCGNCHLVPFKSDTMYRRFIDDVHYVNPSCRILGLTATEYRLQGGDLRFGKNAIFTDIAYKYQIKAALEDGYMTPLFPKAGSELPDTSGMRKVGGEYRAKDQQEAFDLDIINRRAVEEIIHYGKTENRRSWLVFASGVQHANHVCEYFKLNGVTCEVIHGGLDGKTRDAILRDFHDGKIQCVVNVDCLTTGYDNRYIDLIAMLRKTASPGLIIQIMGRGTRIVEPSIFGLPSAEERIAAILSSAKPNCRVLDYGGNFELHGPIDQIQPPPTPGEKKRPGEAPIKECINCKALCYAGSRKCHECGYEFPATGPQISATASTAAILSTQIKAEWLSVDDVSYRFAMEKNKKVMEVVYKCGLMVYKDKVRLEHSGGARNHAVSWWHRHEPGARVPESVAKGLARAGNLPKPSEICVKPNGKYLNVIGRRF